MASITKFDFAWNAFQEYVEGPATFNHNINVTPQELHYTFTHVETNDVIFDVTLSLDELKKSSLYGDQTWWVIKEFTFDAGSSVNLTSNNIVSALSLSLPERRTSLADVNLDGFGKFPFRFFVPFASGDFTDFAYQVSLPTVPPEGVEQPHTFTVTTNLPSESIVLDTADQYSEPSWKWFFCPITITTDAETVTAGDTITCTVTLSDPSSENIEQHFDYIRYNTRRTEPSTVTWSLPGTASNVSQVYLQQIVGTLDRTIVKMVDGVGRFNISTAGFEAGDVIEVKAGYRLFSGINKFTKTLS